MQPKAPTSRELDRPESQIAQETQQHDFTNVYVLYLLLDVFWHHFSASRIIDHGPCGADRGSGLDG